MKPLSEHGKRNGFLSISRICSKSGICSAYMEGSDELATPANSAMDRDGEDPRGL